MWKSKCVNNLNIIVLLWFKIEYVHMLKSIGKGAWKWSSKVFLMWICRDRVKKLLVKKGISVILFCVTNPSKSGAQNNHHFIIFSDSVDCELRQRTTEIAYVCSKIAEASDGQTQRAEAISKDWDWIIWRFFTHILVSSLGWLKACSAGTVSWSSHWWLLHVARASLLHGGFRVLRGVMWLRAPRANILVKKVEGVRPIMT